MTLSIEQQKLHKKAVSDLARKIKSITVKWQVGQLHTWAEVYNFTTVPVGSTAEHLNSKPTWLQLKEYYARLNEELERKFTEVSDIVATTTLPSTVGGETTNKGGSVQVHKEVKEDGGRDPKEVRETSPGTGITNEPSNSATDNVTATPVRNQSTSKPESAKADEDYGLVSSPNEKVFLFWFQKKATAELLNGMLGFEAGTYRDTGLLKTHFATWCTLSKVQTARLSKRCQLLLAGTGTGKTFICGALLRRLVDINFSEGKTYGHIPYLYVTRATVVEQTQRVFSKFFNLTIRDGVEVLNIEQLRAKAGQLWIKEESVVQNGKEVVMYKWKKFQQPCVIIWDECQALKNEGTTQSEISYAYAECMPESTYAVYVSATPFTKVAEAKSFVLNCLLEDKEI